MSARVETVGRSFNPKVCYTAGVFCKHAHRDDRPFLCQREESDPTETDHQDVLGHIISCP